jgi:hypothetical protein
LHEVRDTQNMAFKPYEPQLLPIRALDPTRLLLSRRPKTGPDGSSSSRAQITHQATTNIGRVQQMRILYDEMKVVVRDVTRSLHTPQILDCLFDRPIFRVSNLVAYQIPKPTAHLILRQLEQAAVVKTIRPGAGRRPAIYLFPRLLDIAEDRPSVR